MSEQGAPFPGGFRVFSVGRDAAQRFRVRAPWRVALVAFEADVGA